MVFNIIWLVFWLLFTFKILNTHKQLKLVLDSIVAYVDHEDSAPGYAMGITMLDAMPSFWKPLFRLFDWGYENILPSEYFVILRPYIIMTKEKK